MSMFRCLLMAAKKEEVFTLTIQVAANQTWSFPCHISTGEYLDILDWGDGASDTYVANGTASHTYASAGTYVVKMRGNVTRAQFGVPNNPNANSDAVIDCNGNWTALGNVTDFRYGFSCCRNFTGASLQQALPPNVSGSILSCFHRCSSMTTPIIELSTAITAATTAFRRCTAPITLTELPPKLTSGRSMFYAANLTADLDTLAANAPAGGWSSLTTIDGMFNHCTGVTGSQAAFLKQVPIKAAPYNTQVSDWVFAGAHNTVPIGDYSDTFNMVVELSADNLTTSFTPTYYDSPGLYSWVAVDWGDGNEEMLWQPTLSGTAVTHTYATAGTYTIRMVGQVRDIALPTRVSDNGNTAALGPGAG